MSYGADVEGRLRSDLSDFNHDATRVREAGWRRKSVQVEGLYDPVSEVNLVASVSMRLVSTVGDEAVHQTTLCVCV